MEKILVNGREVGVEVVHFHYQPPQGRWADSDWDCYGYLDIEWVADCEVTEEESSIIDETLAERFYNREGKDEDIHYELWNEAFH